MRKAAWTFYGLVALLFLLFGLLWLKHADWLGHANAHLLGGNSAVGGLKNNFTALWHIRHDANSVHYTGMNAPWGEHVVFTDGQPLFANGIRWLSRRFEFIKNRDLGWLNWMLILGQLVGGACIYLIFRRLHLPAWFAALASVGLVLVAPQNLELTAGHFSLANVWVFPLILLLLIQYEERPYRRPWSLLMAATVVGSAMLHPYFFILAAAFLTLYQAFQVIKRPTWRHFKKRLAHWTVMVLLPFGSVHFWLNLGHSVMDRPEILADFTEQHAKPADVFLPAISTVSGNPQSNTSAYLGLLAVIFTGWLIGRRFMFFEKSWDTEAFHRRQKRFLAGTTFAGLIMLVFALGFPYAWPGGDFWLDWMGPLVQFRGTQKFAWPWFFIGNILFFYVLWQTAKRWKETWLQVLTVAATFSILFLEAFWVQKNIDLHPRANFFLDKIHAAPWLLPIDFKKFQALLPLPYYHEGSEQFVLPADPFLFEKTQMTALETGLPDLGCQLSRTSLGQSIQSLQLVGEPMETPLILDELPTDQPLAIFLSGKNRANNRLKYAHLLEKSRPIWRSDSLEIFSLPIDSLRASVISRRAKIERASNDLPNLKPINGWKSSSSETSGFFSSSWDLNPSAEYFQGPGGFVAQNSDTTHLFKMQMPMGDFAFSIWHYVSAENPSLPQILEKEMAPDGSEIAWRVVNLRDQMVGFVGSWVLFEFDFLVESPGDIVTFEILPKPVNRRPLFFDEMMIRPAETDFFKTTDGWVAKNNHWFRK